MADSIVGAAQQPIGADAPMVMCNHLGTARGSIATLGIPHHMQAIQIGETAIDIPSTLDWRDDEGTVVAYLPETDFANLRFSLLSIKDQSGNLVADAGVRSVTNRCAEFDARLETTDQLVWFYYTKPATEGSEGSLMHYWYVGMDAYVLIVSCFVEATMHGDSKAAFILSLVEPTIRSFRKYRDA